MEKIRPPAVAGTFYPAEAPSLARLVDELLASADGAPGSEAPKALIAPHAGYVYSGPIAASGYHAVSAVAPGIRRVVLLGPVHRVPVRGLVTSPAESFLTPLGEVSVDREAIAQVAHLPQVGVSERAHALEHSLEVQLPFLQQLLGEFAIAPFAVGEASAGEVAEVLELLWGGPETLVVVSSDLSHYYDYATARRLDDRATRAIEALDPEGLDAESACGRIPIRGLLVAARRHGLQARAVDVRNSGDTAGPRDQVVGYGAYVFA